MFFQLLKCFQKVTAGFERHETKLCIITLMYPELQRQGLRWSRLWCLSLFHARNSTENGYGSLKMPTVWSILGSKIRAMLRDPFISGRESLQDLPWLPVDVLQNQRAEFKKSWAIPIAFLHLKPIILRIHGPDVTPNVEVPLAPLYRPKGFPGRRKQVHGKQQNPTDCGTKIQHLRWTESN